jgi:hypothetical protein
MIESRWLAPFSVLVVSMAGCGGTTAVDHDTGGGGTGGQGTGTQGLVGVWTGSATFGSTALTEHVTVGGDGTATATDTFAVVGGGACTGELDIQDAWTATSSTLSVSGGTCSGQAACPNGTTIECGASETSAQTCPYTLSADGNTLVLSCPNSVGPITFTRGN